MCVHFVVGKAFVAVGHANPSLRFYKKKSFTGLRLLNDKRKKETVPRHVGSIFNEPSSTVNNLFLFYRQVSFPFATLYRNKCDKLLISVLLTRTTHSWIDDLFALFRHRSPLKNGRKLKIFSRSTLMSLVQHNWHETWKATSTNSPKLS